MRAEGSTDRSAAFLHMLEEMHERNLVGVEGVREVWLVRHGDAYTGMEGLGEGVLDPPLTPLGREQSARLSQRLADVPIDSVWASDLRRAVETGEAVAKTHGLSVRTDQRLREVRTYWDEGGAVGLNAPDEYPFPESEQDVYERVGAAIRDIVASLPENGRAVAVTHNAAIGIYVSNMLGLGWGKLPVMPMYTSVTILAVKDGRVVLRSLADATHLLEASHG
ncbi:MAG: histidine phosphatase family protein [Candidatus Limnocylindria bacterium]